MMNQCAPEIRQLPFARLMVNPQKLMKFLSSGAGAVQAGPAIDKSRSQAKRGGRPNISKIPVKPLAEVSKQAADVPKQPLDKRGNQSIKRQKLVEFSLKTSLAESVKLAGDFTNWEKSPVAMEKIVDGLWSIILPLDPGVYAYQFIVDGEWCHDPMCERNVLNPYGTKNSIIQVG